jgi:subtilisin family serine protease
MASTEVGRDDYLELEFPNWGDCDPHLMEIHEVWRSGQEIIRGAIFYENGDREKPRAHVILRLKSGNNARQAYAAIPSFREGVKIGDIVTGSIAVKDIPRIFEVPRAERMFESLKAATRLHPDLHNSVFNIRCTPALLNEGLPGYPGLDGSDVIVGIVDSGCDFKHPNFLDEKGETRLLCLWDQTCRGSADNDPEAPAPYGYGREFDAAAINKALQEALQGKDPYKALGYEPAPASHGTHVMDIAAGSGKVPGVAPGAKIIFVHLESDENNFLGTSRHLLDAVHYVFEKASKHGKHGLPAVVNVSFSTCGGPHDGTTPVELGFENLLKKPERQIVLSAGNSFASEAHRDGTVALGSPLDIAWQLDARARKNEMEVWYDGGRSLSVTLITPGGQPLGPVDLGKTANILRGKTRIGRISHRKADPNNQANQIDIRLPPGSGTWTVRLTTEEILGVPFHAWIEQNDRGLGRFVNGSTPYFTLGSICCGESPITVGAYDTFESTYLAQPYEATSAGPTRDKRSKPDVSAPGVGIVAAKGVTEGETFKMSGTSVAAPHVSGLVALLFQLARQTGKELKAGDIQDLLRKTARRKPGKEWDERLGAGRIDGLAALKELVELKKEKVVREESSFAGAESPGNSPENDFPEPKTPDRIWMEEELAKVRTELKKLQDRGAAKKSKPKVTGAHKENGKEGSTHLSEP